MITLTSILSRTEGEEVAAYAVTFDRICTVVASSSSAVALAKADVLADTERIFGEGHLRFSVADSIEKIEEALERVDTWTRKNL